jgi:hypothetical protein
MQNMTHRSRPPIARTRSARLFIPPHFTSKMSKLRAT